MENEKLCPLLKKTLNRVSPYSSSVTVTEADFMPCVKEECAWFDEEDKKCVVVSLSSLFKKVKEDGLEVFTLQPLTVRNDV